jgi:hypothetical protein
MHSLLVSSDYEKKDLESHISSIVLHRIIHKNH